MSHQPRIDHIEIYFTVGGDSHILYIQPGTLADIHPDPKATIKPMKVLFATLGFLADEGEYTFEELNN